MARKKKRYQSIPPQELDRWLEESREMILVDTLPAEQYERRHLPEALNFCVFEVVFMEEIRKRVPDRGHTIVVYGDCWETFEAAAAAEKLVRNGYQNVFTLEGGICGWEEAGFELEGMAVDNPLESADQFRIDRATYTVDPERSRLRWVGRNANGAHTGTLRLRSGSIAPKGKSGFSGMFIVDLTSMTNDDVEDPSLRKVLIEHLMSDDFFFVKEHPEAVFNLRSMRFLKKAAPGSINCEVSGRLVLRGAGADLRFPATVSRLPDGEISAEAHFDFDRTRWGAIYGSGKFFRYLGMHLVYDDVTVQIHLVARPQK
jgi:rhodanese-related sulfurtransferase/polyisoprenoid-binding protein YceI